MTEREAQELIRMVESNWHFDLGPAREMWRTELVGYEAELGTRAIGFLAKKSHYKINLSDVVQAITMFERNARVDDATATKAIEEGRRGWATPEWVWVWKWARNSRDPIEERSFPQQQGHPDDSMTTTDYIALRDEWLAAGSPKDKARVLVRSV